MKMKMNYFVPTFAADKETATLFKREYQAGPKHAGKLFLGILSSIQRQAAEVVRASPDRATVHKTLSAQTTISALELWSIYRGALIEVSDMELLSAVMDTHGPDAHHIALPFQICEFAFPAGAIVADDMELWGAIVVDFAKLDFGMLKELFGFDIRKHVRIEARYAVVFSIGCKSARDGVFYMSKLFDTASELTTYPPLSVRVTDWCTADRESDSATVLGASEEVMSAFLGDVIGVIAGLCDYVAQYRYCGVELREAKKRLVITGVPGPVCTLLKKRPRYDLRSLIPTRELIVQYQNSQKTGKVVMPHQQPGRWRTLRHIKFARESDGSCKAIWVDPYYVHKDHEGAISAERRLAPTPLEWRPPKPDPVWVD